MRLIDADALIESIKAQAGMLNWMLPEADEITDVLSKGFIEQVNKMPTVPQWIPCSERLPEKDGYYLTTTCYRQVYADYWNEDHFDRTEAVIAWMPLPEPYGEEVKNWMEKMCV